MNGSGKFHIRRSAKFEKTQKKLVSTRYKKNKQGVEKFVKLIEKWVKILSVDPRLSYPDGELEPWPDKTEEPGYEFWKLYLKMPQLSGAAGKGRLMYLLNTKQREVTLGWIYTHEEYGKSNKQRPPEKELRRVIKDIMSMSKEVSDIDNNSASAEEGETAESEARDSETIESKDSNP